MLEKDFVHSFIPSVIHSLTCSSSHPLTKIYQRSILCKTLCYLLAIPRNWYNMVHEFWFIRLNRKLEAILHSNSSPLLNILTNIILFWILKSLFLEISRLPAGLLAHSLTRLIYPLPWRQKAEMPIQLVSSLLRILLWFPFVLQVPQCIYMELGPSLSTFDSPLSPQVPWLQKGQAFFFPPHYQGQTSGSFHKLFPFLGGSYLSSLPDQLLLIPQNQAQRHTVSGM